MKSEVLKPRGLKMLLPHGALPEAVSPYMLNLISQTGGVNGPLGRQFIAQPGKERKFSLDFLDPLEEDACEVAPGLIYKYRGKIRGGKVVQYGRVLWTVTRLCATYCRFCTRGREVGMPPNIKTKSKATIAHKFFLDDEDIKKVFRFLRDRPEINEVILSGGDPLTAPRPYLEKVVAGLAALQKEGVIDVVRIGTRLPIHNPAAIENWHYELLAKLKNPYMMLHVNHPAELTEEALAVLEKFRSDGGAAILSQSVFLKGVNDNVRVLHELFVKLVKEGIRPYYLIQNDAVYWATHFTVPMKRAIKIWGKLRPMLSGIAATARLIIDVPHGYGKVVVPEGEGWDVDYGHYFDFKGKRFEVG